MKSESRCLCALASSLPNGPLRMQVGFGCASLRKEVGGKSLTKYCKNTVWKNTLLETALYLGEYTLGKYTLQKYSLEKCTLWKWFDCFWNTLLSILPLIQSHILIDACLWLKIDTIYRKDASLRKETSEGFHCQCKSRKICETLHWQLLQSEVWRKLQKPKTVF